MVPTSPRSQVGAQRYFDHADEFDPYWTIEFGFGAPSNDYSIPLYSAADATTVARVFQRPPDDWNGRFDIRIGDTIPWNPTWRPSDGNDGFMVIIDPSTGHEWDIWALSTPDFHPEYLKQTECLDEDDNVDAGYDLTGDLCAAAVVRIARPDGQLADVRTYRGNYPWAGGGGLQNSAGLATPEEVASGAIRHALKFMVSGTLAMTGPACPADVTTPDDPRVGTTCGISVAPAGIFERLYTHSTPAQLSNMVPAGTRLVVDRTDAQIDAWLDARGYTGRLRETARIFAVARRDYGLIQTDTTGGPAVIQVAGARNPDIAAGWRGLGITGDGAHLLDGLITRDSLRVLSAATNRCDGALSHLGCWAEDTGYGTLTSGG
jgi:hypothetical protein